MNNFIFYSKYINRCFQCYQFLRILMQRMAQTPEIKMMQMHSMTITWNYQQTFFLFQSLAPNTLSLFILGCIFAFFVSMLAQLMHYPPVKTYFKTLTYKQKGQNDPNVSVNIHPELINSPHQKQLVSQKKDKSTSPKGWKTMKIFVYNLTYSLLTMTMMLLAMSMNGFVILTLAFGTALGKTIFHPDSQNICQEQRDKRCKNMIEEKVIHTQKSANCCDM